MGNHHFHHHHHHHHHHNINNQNENDKKATDDEELCEQDRKLIRSSWNQLRLSQDFKSLGSDLMTRYNELFKEILEKKKIFNFFQN
jgi:hypothetical protein